MEKVKLPRAVAEALDQIKTVHKYPIRAVIEKFTGNTFVTDYPALADYFEQDRSRRIETIMKALINDYEIEETPEEQIAAYYKKAIMQIGPIKASNTAIMEAYAEGQMQAIHFVLNKLGKEIEGIPFGEKGTSDHEQS